MNNATKTIQLILARALLPAIPIIRSIRAALCPCRKCAGAGLADSTSVRGECFCGALQYQVNGLLRDARSYHCLRYRKAFSSQVSAYALVEPDEFECLQRCHLLTSYVDEQGFVLQFCRVCGSTPCGIYNGAIHGVTLGCINDDRQIELGRHIYVGSKASWETIAEGVPQYQQDMAGNT